MLDPLKYLYFNKRDLSNSLKKLMKIYSKVLFNVLYYLDSNLIIELFKNIYRTLMLFL